MPTREEMQAASDRVDAAEAALKAYVDRTPDVDSNPEQHRQLTEELRAANDAFLETMK
jgi:hypothetical protein